MKPNHPYTPPSKGGGQRYRPSPLPRGGVGGVVAYPTESFYALGAKATDPQAIRQLFHLKHRQVGKPIALIAADVRQVKRFFYVSPAEEKLMNKHWPGALTILLNPKKAMAVYVLLGLTTPSPLLTQRRGPDATPRYARRIGVRVPAHAGARRLAARVGAPITATSANISGQPPTKSSRKVKHDFPGILIVSGRCGKQQRPSTVVEIVKSKNIIHRQGAVHPVRSSCE